MKSQPKGLTIAGWVITVLVSALMLMSAAFKFSNDEAFKKQATESLGVSVETVRAIGVVEIVRTVAYLVPLTTTLGAVLLTGYLGGAIVTHVRLGDPFVIPAAIGVLVWLGVFLREPRLRRLLPLVRADSPATRDSQSK